MRDRFKLGFHVSFFELTPHKGLTELQTQPFTSESRIGDLSMVKTCRDQLWIMWQPGDWQCLTL